MEASAKIKNQRGSARKVRLVADLIRNKKVDEARDILNFSKKRAARSILKILDSAVANAANKSGKVEIDKLFINKITVDEGITMKRWRSRAMGRADMISKRTHHIALSVTDEMES
ncbi:MAG: 50S ribosomal protein L22 [Candidatus Cloacimonetes bacterium]|nr:50S ribosomal protein L22 [Candidatus Cloacimonadota bacterium]